MRRIILLAALTLSLAECLLGQTYNWVRANDEAVQLDPADYHTGRVYRPGPNGGNIHVGIEAKQPVTILLAWADEWNAALQHPQTIGNLEFRCVREHVMSTTYECHCLRTVPWC